MPDRDDVADIRSAALGGGSTAAASEDGDALLRSADGPSIVPGSPSNPANQEDETTSNTGQPIRSQTAVRNRNHANVAGVADVSATADDSSAAGASDKRAGVDARRRGWFWHWNNVVTQYAPLIGLKGVGLLNSYTVWTDRRDESPHRGFAFPSQQSEADFYGEDRAELITINKILVALDLIEIRKEMLSRVDARGRRWRVPHNLYRVKDRPDGVDLRADDVLNVAKLAHRDEAVFRYVRRVFSDRFQPIDGDNVWHAILNDLRNDPTWRELQERTRTIEARASARTRAGHQSRAGGATAKSEKTQTASTTAPESGTDRSAPDNSLLPDAQQASSKGSLRSTSVAATNRGSVVVDEIDVEPTNIGSAIDVADTNNGLATKQTGSVAGTNQASHGSVGPSNTTYDQDKLTTTTTTSRLTSDDADNAQSANARSVSELAAPAQITDPTTELEASQLCTSSETNTDGSDGVVDVHENRQAAVRALERDRDADDDGRDSDEGVMNDRDQRVDAGWTKNRQLDDRIERDGDEQRAAVARASGGAGERRLADPAGGGPLVDPGPLVISTFEAANDRRATPLERHLLAELERDADPPARAAGSSGADWVVAAMREAVSSGSAFVAPKRIREITARWTTDSRDAPTATPPLTDQSQVSNPTPVVADQNTEDVRLPGGVSGRAIWASVLAELAGVFEAETFERLLSSSRIARYWRGTVEIHVGSSAAADKLSNEYRGVVERHLNNRLRRPVAVRFASTASVQPGQRDHGSTGRAAEPPIDETSQRLVVAESDVDIGRQVWQALLGDLKRVATPADLDRLAGVVVLGQDATGVILLGTPSPLARRLIDGRYRSDVETALAALLGQSSPVRALEDSEWIIAADSPSTSNNDTSP